MRSNEKAGFFAVLMRLSKTRIFSLGGAVRVGTGKSRRGRIRWRTHVHLPRPAEGDDVAARYVWMCPKQTLFSCMPSCRTDLKTKAEVTRVLRMIAKASRHGQHRQKTKITRSIRLGGEARWPSSCPSGHEGDDRD